MLPIIIPFEPTTLMSIAKGLLLLNPTSFFFIGAMIVLWLTLKTVTAKLAFVGVSLLLSAIIGYCIYRSDKKQKQNQMTKKNIDFSDSFFDSSKTNEKQEEEKELMLSRMFKK